MKNETRKVEKFITYSNLVKLRSNNMVQALVEIDENTNRVLNIVKAQYNLKDKGDVIEFIVDKYIEMKGEPELKPEFIEKIKQVEKEKSIHVKNFAKRYGLK